MKELYYLLSFLLISMSTYHFITAINLVKRLIAVNILGSGVFLFFVATAKNTPSENPDPVPQLKKAIEIIKTGLKGYAHTGG